MSRVRLALRVSDLEGSIAFHSKLFGVEPWEVYVVKAGTDVNRSVTGLASGTWVQAYRRGMTHDITVDQGWAPSACTLPTTDRPLRAAEFDALFTEAVRAITRPRRTRLRLELALSPEHAARAAELGARENGCCAFFTFTLTITGGHLVLEVAVPAEQAEVLDALQERAAASTVPAGRPA